MMLNAIMVAVEATDMARSAGRGVSASDVVARAASLGLALTLREAIDAMGAAIDYETIAHTVRADVSVRAVIAGSDVPTGR